jgi:hypothetical protein
MQLGPNQQKWINALESGNFVQGQKFLKVIQDGKPQHCCLGVACEIFKEELNLEEELNPGIGGREIVSFDHGSSVLPDKVQYYLGLWSSNGNQYDEGRISLPDCLSNMNDRGFTFKEIVESIKAFPQLYFEESK